MRDTILATIVAVIAIGYLVVDAHLPDIASGDPVGPRIYPALLGIGLLASALIQFAEQHRKRSVAKVVPVEAPDQRRQCFLVAFVAVWTMLYYVTLERLGYLTATTLFIFALLIYFNPRRHIVNAVIALCFSVLVYALFTKFLLIALPQGLIGF